MEYKYAEDSTDVKWNKVVVKGVEQADDKTTVEILTNKKTIELSWPSKDLEFCGIHTAEGLCAKNDLRPDRIKLRRTFAFVDDKMESSKKENYVTGATLTTE